MNLKDMFTGNDLRALQERGKFWQKGLSLIHGCTKFSSECDNCWAEKGEVNRRHILEHRLNGVVDEYGFTGKVNLMWNDIQKPEKRKKPTVYAIWNDLFHEKVPIKFLDKFFEMTNTFGKQHIFIVITKRIERARWYFHFRPNKYDNIVFLYTCGTKIMAEHLSQLPLIPIETKGFIAEPLLEVFNVPGFVWDHISWVIVGAENAGKKTRHISPAMVRYYRNLCKLNNTFFFFKSWGGIKPPVGDKKSTIDGESHRDMPYMFISQ